MDYTYSRHVRQTNGVHGTVVLGKRGTLWSKGDVIQYGPTEVIENRVNGVLRTVTVISATGKALARLDGPSVRIY